MYLFNTSIAGPSLSPGNVMVTKIGSTFVEVVWSEPDLSGHNGVIRSYTLLINELQGDTSFNLTSTSTQVTVTNLHPFYMYSISVAAVTTSPGPYSIQVAVTTLQDGMYVLYIIAEVLYS